MSIDSREAFLLMIAISLLISASGAAQSWEFAKEKDGIKIYTRKDTGKSLKSYKGVASIQAKPEAVFAMIENVNNTEWWDQNISQIKVLLYEKFKKAQYYLVYDLPWPVTDRDLCVDVTVTVDPEGVGGVITAVPLQGMVPVSGDKVRITEYRQTWTVKPEGDNITSVVLEGYVDPAGSIPDWISNMLIVDSPLRVINGVKQRIEKK